MKVISHFILIFFLPFVSIGQGIRFVNNCSDKSCDTLKVWIDNTYEKVAFREIAYNGIHYAPVTLTLGVSLKTATNVTQCIAQTTVVANDGYIIAVINGIADNGNLYTPNSQTKPVSLLIYSNAIIGFPPPFSTSIRSIHGSTDTGTINFSCGSASGILQYGASSFLGDVPATRTIIAIGSPVLTQQYYKAPLDNYAGKIVTIISSGFADPSVNNNGSKLGLWVIPDDINLTKLIPLERDLTVDIGHNETNHFAIYPNPSTDRINIRCLNSKNVHSLIVSDLSGRRILAFDSFSSKPEVDVSSLSKGMYFLTLQLENEIVQQLFIKE